MLRRAGDCGADSLAGGGSPKVSGFLAENDAGIAPGMKMSFAEEEVGEITSVASPVAGQPQLALGYIRREIAVPGQEVLIGTAQAEIRELPFKGV